MSTQNDLLAAFAGESQANRRYLAFAKKAEAEQLPNLAKLFRAAAEGETVHALKHLNVAGGVKSTRENLEVAIAGETHEINEMYPSFVREAEAENNSPATIGFTGALKVEGIHRDFFQKALESLKTGQDIAESEYYICQTCGNPALGSAPEKCPICGQPRGQFVKLV